MENIDCIAFQWILRYGTFVWQAAKPSDSTMASNLDILGSNPVADIRVTAWIGDLAAQASIKPQKWEIIHISDGLEAIDVAAFVTEEFC